MRQITAWRTMDGKIFDCHRRAQSYAEERYGAALTKLAHGAVKQEKYAAMLAWIEANIGEFDDLRRLARDREVVSDCQFPEED